MRKSIFCWLEALRQFHRAESSVQNVDQQNGDQVLKLPDDAAIANHVHLADRQRPVSIPFGQAFYNWRSTIMGYLDVICIADLCLCSVMME